MINSSSDNYAPLTEAERRALRTRLAASKLLKTSGLHWEIKDPWEIEAPRAAQPHIMPTPSPVEAELRAYMAEMKKTWPITK